MDKPAVAGASLANVSASATSVTLAAANPSRLGLTIYNDSAATLSVKFGATASSTSKTVDVAPYGTYEMPQEAPYLGVVDGLWSSATGAARVTELTC